ncbi:MAG: hypothetical protein AAB516_01100 [Patescibacteria group bacterium]
MQKLKTKISVGVMAGLSTLLGSALLVVAGPPPIPSSPVTSVTGIVDVIDNVVRWVYIIFFILAVLFIIFAAFTYLTAGGDEEKVKKAKDQIIYAAVAIVVALLAVGFQTIIGNFLTSGG